MTNELTTIQITQTLLIKKVSFIISNHKPHLKCIHFRLKNKVFVCIFTFIFVAQLYIIYNGGEIFRTYGLELNELILVFIIALTVFPVDWLRKYILKKKHIAIGV